MDKVLLVCQSQTEALMLQRMLLGAGVSGQVVRTPRGLAGGSCSYAVSIPASRLATAQQRMREKRFMPCKIV